MNTVLFLCTGNYYRSRFAEELFNHLAEPAGVEWVADSRALALERGINNIGPLSRYAVQGLDARDVAIRGKDRMPQQCELADLEGAHRIVALDEDEHRPLILERFPAFDRRAEYWRVPDIEILAADVALANIAERVEALIAQLRTAP
jgi:protein-tyrosine phosphatase